jgi:hypothetical protein
MKIAEDVRKYAAEQELRKDGTPRAGMEQKAKQFAAVDAEIY